MPLYLFQVEFCLSSLSFNREMILVSSKNSQTGAAPSSVQGRAGPSRAQANSPVSPQRWGLGL